MLQSRNLDDQTFDEIMEQALERIPWVCPDWTDYNEHDPGITILELIAWYKEMQQYHMNRLTDGLRSKLLKLAGIRRSGAVPAVVGVMVPEGKNYPRLSRLETEEGIPLELLETAVAGRPELVRVLTEQGMQYSDITYLTQNPMLILEPFQHGGLLLGFRPGTGDLRLWFEAAEETICPRNPYAEANQVPRVLRWTTADGVPLTVLEDETHSLSHSGMVRLSQPAEWSAEIVAGGEALCWLRVTLEEQGCEGGVRLTGITSRRYPAVQQETWAAQYHFTVERASSVEVSIEDALAQEGIFLVFLRTVGGWRQIQPEQQHNGWLQVNTMVVEEGEDNLWVVCLDGVHSTQLCFDSDGLPGQTLPLNCGMQQAVELALICDTRMEDGSISPALWRQVNDLYACGSKDRVFCFDREEQVIRFGDGLNGAVVPVGKNAVIAAALRLSACERGNIPQNGGLHFCADGTAVKNSAGTGGQAEERLAEAEQRLLRRLETVHKCASSADYEQTALRTPGLRVSAAKALPGFDRSHPERSGRPLVSVVVVPYSGAACPMPDKGFLAAVQRELNRVRPICTVVQAIAPRYAAISIEVHLKGHGGTLERQCTAALRALLDGGGIGCGIGVGLSAGRVSGLLQEITGVEQVKQVELRALDSASRVNSAGDLISAPDAILWLKDSSVIL